MPLSTIRVQFIAQNGRFDLDNSGISGANLYIQAGNRILDDLQLMAPEQSGSYRIDLEAGDYYVEVPQLRSAKLVWVTKSDGSRTELEKKAAEWIRANYSDPALASIDTGTPAYWTPATPYLPAQLSLTGPPPSAQFSYDYGDVLFGNKYHKRMIFFMPPASEAMTLTVEGHFYGVLSEDTDETFWSEEHPFLLLQASHMAVEMSYRNTQGVNDYLNNIILFTKGIYRNAVVENSYGINRIK